MRWVLRIFGGLVALAVVLLVAGVVIVSTTDFTAYRDEIAAEIEGATGRKVTLAGRIETSFLSLSPKLVVNGISFANAKGGSRPTMLTARRAEVSVALLPLIGGTVKVRSLTLIGADLLLETDRDGQRNWVFGSPAPSAPKPSGTPETAPKASGHGLPEVNHLRIKDSRFTYRDGRTGLVTRVSVGTLDLRAATPGEPIQIDISGSYNGAPVRASGTLGSLASLRTGTSAFPVRLAVRFGDTDAKVDLKADLSAAVPAIAGSVTGDVLDLDGLSGPAGSSGARSGRLFSAEPLPVGILHAANADVRIAFKAIKRGAKRWSGASARARLTDGLLSLSDLRTGLAGGTIAGTVTVDARSSRPMIKAVLSGQNLSLAEMTEASSDRRFVESRLRLSLNVTGQGESARAIAASLAGPVIIDGGPGPIASGTLSFLSTSLGSVIPGLSSGQRLSLRCLVARFDFRAGIGYSRVFVVDTTRVTAVGQGVVSLRNEAVDLLFVPATKGVSIASVAALVPVRVRGPMRSPTIGPDPGEAAKETMKTIIGTGERGVNFIGGLLGVTKSRQRAVDPCASARARLSGRTSAPPRAPAPTRKRSGPGGLLNKINPFSR